MSTYVGITIGPIFDTISEASFPAALWFSSTLFSDITRRICMEILEPARLSNVKKINLISPAFDPSDQNGLSDGIGKYHDRIIFSVECCSQDMPEQNIAEWLDQIIQKVKKDTIQIFPLDMNHATDNTNKDKLYSAFLDEYLQIHYCMLDAENVGDQNCILVLSPYLDALECMKTFPKEDVHNPIREIMKNTASRIEGSSKSEFIKRSQLFKNVQVRNNQLIKANDQSAKRSDIWDIGEIASGAITGNRNNDHKAKYKNYFATVTADADSMSAFLNRLSPDTTTLFSEKCLEYSKQASKEIGAYGGMTIYAGGDDLLFLAPVLQNNDQGTTTVFELCNLLADTFKKIMEGCNEFKGLPIPTISFGISIRYKKYPLYEALEDSRSLLERAKKETYMIVSEGESKPKAIKNSMAVSLQKHSGQQCGFVMSNKMIGVVNDFVLKSYKHLKTEEPDEQNILRNIILGIGSQIEKKYTLIDTMDAMGLVKTSWENLFDNEGQKSAESFINEINTFYYNDLRPDENKIISMVDQKTKERYGYHNENLNALLALLRMARFFIEKADEKEGTADGMVSAEI